LAAELVRWSDQRRGPTKVVLVTVEQHPLTTRNPHCLMKTTWNWPRC